MKKILFVDDEPNLLSAFERQLHGRFDVQTTGSPKAALELLKNCEDFSVVVADMGMPEMNGIELLTEAGKIAPNVVRIMLTGYLDQTTAVEAVNQGHIYRFLTKPCPAEKIVAALDDAVARHDLILAEHELLENTLGGSLKVLSEILALSEPNTFGQAEALRDSIRLLANSMKVAPTWELEAAALLSQIGFVTIPPDLILKSRQGQQLTPREKDVFTRIPSIGSSLLSRIPRLENVARIILYQNKRFDGGGFPEDAIAGESIPVGARMLKVLIDLGCLEAAGTKRPAALTEMREHRGCYDPRVLEAVAALGPIQRANSPSGASSPTAVKFSGLRVGHMLCSDLETKGGILLVTAGNRITPMLIHRLRNFSAMYGIQEPIYVDEGSTTFFTLQRHATETDDVV